MMTKPENVKCPNCQGEMKSVKSSKGRYWLCKKFGCGGTRDSMGESKADREKFRNDEDNWDKFRWR